MRCKKVKKRMREGKGQGLIIRIFSTIFILWIPISPWNRE